jgi:hypothetical protein
VWRQDYQRTLVHAVRNLQRNGRARVMEIRRLNFAPSCRNEPTLIVWEPLKSQLGEGVLTHPVKKGTS